MTVRWAFCRLWNRVFPRSCWAENALWGLGWEGNHLRRERIDRCENDLRDNGTCWCGKLKKKVEQ